MASRKTKPSKKSKGGKAASTGPLEPVYVTSDVNTPIELYSGPMLFRYDGDELSGEGGLLLEWLPSPQIRFRLRVAKELQRDLRLVFELPDNEEAEVELSDIKKTVKTYAAGAGHVSESEFEVNGIVGEEIVFGKQDRLASLLFHLPNVPEIALSPDRFVRESGRGAYSVERVLLSGDEWVVTLDPAQSDSSLIKDLKSSRGYGITRIGKLERAGGKTFTLNKARVVLEIVQHLLSFALHRWCPPILLVGFDRDGSQRCQAWTLRRISPFQPHMGWFNLHHPAALAELLPAFQKRWKDEQWREAMKDAVYWFVEMHRLPVHLETAIVLGQTALEMLGWLLLVEDRPIVSEDGFRSLPAADKLKLVLSFCSIPVAPPDELKALRKLAKAENWQGPDCVAQIRNSIMHRNRKKREQAGKKKLTEHDILWECYKLVCWYIEMVLLRQLGYRGDYSNRLKRRWVGQTEPVPWAENTEARK